eukprot:7333061-Prorocentrum_lima.AAC.1
MEREADIVQALISASRAMACGLAGLPRFLRMGPGPHLVSPAHTASQLLVDNERPPFPGTRRVRK